MSDEHAELLDGRYALRRELGRGGICVVHEAHHRFTERRVAVKTLLPEYADNAYAAERLLVEATALGRVRHPCVVEAIDAGRAEGRPYLVMELLEGGRSLEGVLATRSTLGVTAGVRLVRRMADAIAVSHEAGVVHRDIKPGNVLLVRVPLQDDPSRKHTAVKVIDFGLATVDNPIGGNSESKPEDGIVGTPEYMSLERLMGTSPNLPAGDVYALGVTLYECLTGTVPFPGNYPQVLQAVATTEARRLSLVRSGVPESISDVVHRALAREPQGRYLNARQFCDALDTAYGDLDQTIAESAPSEDAAKRRKFSRAAYITPVHVTLDGETFDARSEDLSEGGLLVLAPHAMRLGATGEIRWALPVSGTMVTTRVRAQWSRANPEHPQAPCALGLEFVDADAQTCSEIIRYAATAGSPV